MDSPKDIRVTFILKQGRFDGFLLLIIFNINFIRQMNNPEAASSGNISPRVMYKYDCHTNIPWNITQY